MRRKCKICKKPAKYVTSFGWGNCGHPDCGIELHRMTREKEAKLHDKAYRAETRRRKEKLNDTVPYWTKKAQVAFNAYIRNRDKDLPCISCGRLDSEIEHHLPGGRWDCGHFLSVGAFPELRFEEKNAHKQCKACNGGSGRFTKKNSTVAKEYRERLIKKIGIIDVEWLEGPHPQKRYRVEELKEIEKLYKQKLKELKCE